MLELMFLKEVIVIKQVHQRSVIFVTTSLFLAKGLIFSHLCVIDAMIYDDEDDEFFLWYG